MAKLDQLQGPLRDALDQAVMEAITHGLNPVVPPRGAYRSRADQQSLFASRGSNPNPVAAPGTSLHEQGAAVDIHDATGRNDLLEQIMNKYGLFRPDPQGDPPHYQYQGPSEGDVLQRQGFTPPSPVSSDPYAAAFAQATQAPLENHGRGVPPLPQGNPPVLPPVPATPGPQGAAAPSRQNGGDPYAAAFAVPSGEFTSPELQPRPAAPAPPAHPEEIGVGGFLRNWYNAAFHPPDGSIATGVYNAFGYPLATGIDALGLGGLVRPLAGLYFAGANVANKAIEQIGAGLGFRTDIPAAIQNQELINEPATLADAAQQGYYSAGGTFFRPLKSLTGQDDAVSQVGDLLADWIVGGKVADLTIGPIFHGAATLAGKAGGAALDAAEHLPVVGDRLAAYRAAAPLKAIVKAEYAQAGREVNSLTSRFEAIADTVRRKSAADPHPEGQFFAGIGLENDLYSQAINQYVEAGTPLAFATDRGQVLNRAASLGLDTQFIRQQGERLADLYDEIGQRRAAVGQLDPLVQQQNAGFYVPRDYHVFSSDPATIAKVMERLDGLGEEGALAKKILQDRLDNPQGAPVADFSPSGKVATSIPNRVIMTPAERAALVPEMGFIGAGFQNVPYMARQVAHGEALARLAANPAIAADAIKGQVAQAALDNLMQRPAVPKQLPRNPEVVAEGKAAMAIAQERLSAAIENQGRVQALANGVARRVQKATEILGEHNAKGAPVQPEPPPPPTGELPAVGELTPKQRQAAVVQQAAADLAQARQERDTGVRGRTEQAQLEKQLKERLKIEQDFHDVIPEVTGTPTDKGPAAHYGALLAKQKDLYGKALDAHAEALDRWQKDVARYHARTQQLTDQLANRHAEFEATQRVNGETVAERQAAEAQRDAAQRKIDRGRGLIPDAQHAADAVEEYTQRLGKEFTPEEKAFLGQKWLDAAQRGQDIFHSKLPEVEIPKGADPAAVADLQVTHPADAIAQDPLLAAQNTITPEEAKARGFTTQPWTGKQYGAMNGKYGSVIAKQIVDASIRPDKYELMAGRAGPLLEALSRNYRFIRAYANPTTHINVMKGQFMQALTGAAERDVNLLPHLDTYFAGMKELAQYRKTGKTTPLIEAMLKRDSPLRVGVFTPEERQLNSRVGVSQSTQGTLKTNISNPIVQRFIDIHMMPKMGLAKVLAEHDGSLMKGLQVPAGISPEALQAMRYEAAAAAAERAMGGMEEGAVHYPGQTDIEGILKAANRYGFAPFTAYPLHTLNRFFELVHSNPSLLLRYPQIRSYLYAASPESAGERFKEKQVDYDELPIPFLSRGKTPLFYRAGHMLPGEDAAQDVDIGGAILGLPHGPLGSAVDWWANRKGYDRKTNVVHEGVSPDVLASEANRKAIYSLLPSSFGTGALRLYRSLHGEAPYGGTSRVENPVQPLAAEAGFDTHYPESRLERRVAGDVPAPKDNRLAFYQSVLDDMDRRPQAVKDYSSYYKGKDGHALLQLHQAARMELRKMLGDTSITDEEAKPKIRAQAAFMRGIEQRAGQGPHLYDAAQ